MILLMRLRLLMKSISLFVRNATSQLSSFRQWSDSIPFSSSVGNLGYSSFTISPQSFTVLFNIIYYICCYVCWCYMYCYIIYPFCFWEYLGCLVAALPTAYITPSALLICSGSVPVRLHCELCLNCKLFRQFIVVCI